ncbi:uncharacterized protein V6R79_001398 [Siganus canaliculatus]
MAAEEPGKINVLTEPSAQALEEYEDLQKKHETTSLECERLVEERDQAILKLNEFHQVSQMVIKEVSAIQEHLEIERTCRESAEALASKLNRQNRSLKRKSLMLLSHINPETVTSINLGDEEDDENEELPSGQVCLSAQCQTSISVLQNNLKSTTEEKHQAITALEVAREQLRQTKEELLKEKHDNTVLIAETMKQKKLLGKYNRVSQFAVEEFQDLQNSLNLERDLRTEAENYAREMMIEQRQLKRQSQILMQSDSPSQALEEALGQVSKLTKDLETQKLEHQNQIKQMEDRLRSCEVQKELAALRRKLELVEEERKDYSDKYSKAKVEVRDLQLTVEQFQKKLQEVTNPLPAPRNPPPPPPPLPPPAPPPLQASNPLSALMSLIRKRRNIRTDIPLEVQDSGNPSEVDIKQQAVEEMMHRIKKGVKLRPVSQSANRRQVAQAVHCPVFPGVVLFWCCTCMQLLWPIHWQLK